MSRVNTNSAYVGPVKLPRNQPGLKLLLVILIWLLVVLESIALADAFQRALGVALISTVLLFPLAYRISQQSLDLFEPLLPATVALAAMFVGRPLLDQVSGRYSHLGYGFNGSFDNALYVALLGCIAFEVGYLQPFRFAAVVFPKGLPRFPLRVSATYGLALGLSGLALFSSFIASVGLGGLLVLLGGRSRAYDDLLRSSTAYQYGGLSLLQPASFIFFGLAVAYRKWSLAIWGCLLAFPFVAFHIISGDRSALLPFATGAASIYYLYTNRRPVIWKLVLVGVVGLSLSSAIRTLRFTNTAQSQTTSGGGDFFLNPSDAALSTFSQDDDEMFDTLANIVEFVPAHIPFRNLGAITDIGIRVMPRILFPGKPLEMNDQLNATLWPQRWARTRGSAASSLIGYFYLDSGFLSVAVGMFLIGAVLRAAWEWYLRHPKNMGVILLYAFVPGLVINVLRGTLITSVASSIFSIVPMIIFQLLVRRATRGESYASIY